MKDNPHPLDEAYLAWVRSVSAGVAEDLLSLARKDPWFYNPTIRIAMNDRVARVHGGDERCMPALFETQETDSLIKSFRAFGLDRAWPLALNIEIQGLDSKRGWRATPALRSIDVFGLRLKRDGKLLLNSRYNGPSGLGLLPDLNDLLQKATPPSNAPVRSWSRVSDLMGTAHVYHQGVYARSEAEALLKIMIHQDGLQSVQRMISDGQLTCRDGPFKSWFISSEIRDLDLHPEGATPMREDALSQLNDHLSGMAREDLSPS